MKNGLSKFVFVGWACMKKAEITFDRKGISKKVKNRTKEVFIRGRLKF